MFNVLLIKLAVPLVPVVVRVIVPCLLERLVESVVANPASLLIATANSFRVFNASGADATRAATWVPTYSSVATFFVPLTFNVPGRVTLLLPSYVMISLRCPVSLVFPMSCFNF